MKVDLHGPQGNAFVLGGIAIDVARRLSRSEAQIRDMTSRMSSGGFKRLLDTIDLEFPFLFDFVNDPRSTEELELLAEQQEARFPVFLLEVATAEREVKRRHGPKAVL